MSTPGFAAAVTPHSLPQRRYTDSVWLAALLLLLVATVGFFEGTQGWLPVGDELVIDGQFVDWQEQWSVSDGVSVGVQTDGTLLLESVTPISHAGLAQAIPFPPACSHVQIILGLGVSEVLPGDQPWQRARAVLGRRTQLGGWSLQAHPALYFEGTAPVEEHVAVLPCPSSGPAMYLRVELHEVTGKILLRSVSVLSVVENPTVVLGRRLAIGLWLAFGLLALHRYRAQVLDLGRSPSVLVLTVLILLGVLVPGSIRDAAQESTGIAGHIGQVSMASLGHAILFALLAASLSRVSGIRQLARSALLLILLAIVSEVLQYLSPGRSPSLPDLLVDLAGIVSGLTVATLWHRLYCSGSHSS